MGTAAQPVIGVGAHTEVKVADRPLTQAGLTGMKTGSLGPKRQVYDKTYYIGELRKRCMELQEEVAKLNKEVEQTRQDNMLYQNLEKRYDQLVKTVRALEGDLADHNLATDKQRTDTRPEEVHHMYLLMKQQNDQQRQDVDQIFLEKRSHEEEIQKMNDEINGLARAAEERLNELHPDQQREYEMLKEEQQHLNQDLAEGRDELDQVSHRLNVLQGHLRSDPLRTRCQQLQQVRREAVERLEELEAEARQYDMPIPEQRELLLNKVKTDNAEIVAAEKAISELKLDKERLRARIEEVIADTQERRDDSDQQKYEILFAKDQEMTQFIEGFEDSKRDEEQKLKDKQESILILLENISKVATQGKVDINDMQDELDFKQGQLQNSETTQSRLEGERAKRSGELEKIESLDAKIAQELQQVEAKMQEYEREIEMKFDRVANMKEAGNAQVQKLGSRKAELEVRLSALQQQVNCLQLDGKRRKQQLADTSLVKDLDAQEAKIRQFAQTRYTLESFIRQRTMETDCTGEETSCLDMAAQLNKMLQEKKFAPM